MKKLLIRSVALVAFLAFSTVGAQAASYDAGTFSDLGDSFSTPQPVGNFLDSYSLTVDSASLDINITGTHQGMFQDDLLLTNINTNEQYHLGTTFSETLSLGAGEYIFTISGFALNSIDTTLNSDYDLTMSAVPLPAAAWLFGSALLGFVSFSRRRKV
ncbi:MAG: VPLPA-CTERM sorting domain-containing protein [Candidatus Thiodiazotropha sp. 6PLUC1]